MEVYHPKGPNTSEGLEPPKIKPIMEENIYTKVCVECGEVFSGKGKTPIGVCEECEKLKIKIHEASEEVRKYRLGELELEDWDTFKKDVDKRAEMLEYVEHAIKNFDGRLVDCVAIGEMYKEYLEMENEIDKLEDSLFEQDKLNHVLQSQLDVANAEKIMYKKIAEFLANEVKKDVVYYGKDGFDFCEMSEEDRGNCTKHAYGTACIQCIIDWAKSEVENGTDN